MGFRRILCVILTVVLFTVLLSGCGLKKDAPGETAWQFDEIINEPITITTGNEEVTVGNLSTHGIEVAIPAGAFEEPTTIRLSHPEEEVIVDTRILRPQGSLYSFSIEGDQKRSDLPMTLRIAVDSQLLSEAEEIGGYRGLHYNEVFGWTTIQPKNINVEEGYVAFEIYHNRLTAAGELTREARIDDFSTEISKAQWAQSQIKGDVDALTKEIVEQMIIGGFDEDNPNIIGHITNEVSKELMDSVTDYAAMVRDINSGNYESLSINIAKKAGKSIAKALKDEVLKKTVKHVGVASQAAGALVEGDLQGAMEHYATFVKNNSKIAKAGQLAIDSVDAKINNWRNEEIEKAFQIYVNGTESYLPWGYNVDAGDFNSLWAQMRGVAHKIQSDALTRYARIMDIHIDHIPAEKADELRIQARQALKEQFEARKQQEKEIEAFKENNDYVMERLEDWGMLRPGSSFYPRDMTIEQMLHRIYKQMDGVFTDTNRFNMVYKSGDLHDQSRGSAYIGNLRDDELMLEQVIELVHIKYTEGHEAYFEKLIELGLIVEDDSRLNRLNTAVFLDSDTESNMGWDYFTELHGYYPFQNEIARLGVLNIPEDDVFIYNVSNVTHTVNKSHEKNRGKMTYHVDHMSIEMIFDVNKKEEGFLFVHGSGTFSYKGRINITNEKGNEGESGYVIAERSYNTDIQGIVTMNTLFAIDEMTGERKPATIDDIDNLEQMVHDYCWYTEVTSGSAEHVFTIDSVDDSGELKQIHSESDYSLPLGKSQLYLKK